MRLWRAYSTIACGNSSAASRWVFPPSSSLGLGLPSLVIHWLFSLLRAIQMSGGLALTVKLYANDSNKPKALKDKGGYYRMYGTRSGDKLRKHGITIGMTALEMAKKIGRAQHIAALEAAASALGASGGGGGGGGGAGAGAGSAAADAAPEIREAAQLGAALPTPHLVIFNHSKGEAHAYTGGAYTQSQVREWLEAFERGKLLKAVNIPDMTLGHLGLYERPSVCVLMEGSSVEAQGEMRHALAPLAAENASRGGGSKDGAEGELLMFVATAPLEELHCHVLHPTSKSRAKTCSCDLKRLGCSRKCVMSCLECDFDVCRTCLEHWTKASPVGRVRTAARLPLSTPFGSPTRLVLYDEPGGATYLCDAPTIDAAAVRSFVDEYRDGGLLRDASLCKMVLSHPSVVLLLEKSPEQMQATLRSELAAVARASHAAGRGLRFFVALQPGKMAPADEGADAELDMSDTANIVREAAGLGPPTEAPHLVLLDQPREAVYACPLIGPDASYSALLDVADDSCAAAALAPAVEASRRLRGFIEQFHLGRLEPLCVHSLGLASAQLRCLASPSLVVLAEGASADVQAAVRSHLLPIAAAAVKSTAPGTAHGATAIAPEELGFFLATRADQGASLRKVAGLDTPTQMPQMVLYDRPGGAVFVGTQMPMSQEIVATFISAFRRSALTPRCALRPWLLANHRLPFTTLDGPR